MNTPTSKARKPNIPAGAIVCVAALLAGNAHAAMLDASAGGTFTMSLDRNALSPYWGYKLSNFWDAATSDIDNPAYTAGYFSQLVTNSEIDALNRVFPLTAIGFNPANQPAARGVKATSASFSLDSDLLTGSIGAEIGMLGIQGFYAPNWQTQCCGMGGGLINGDFSVAFDPARQTDGRSGWYLANNIYFTMATYDFANLSLSFSDADNWRLSGDLLMAPENGNMLKGASLNDVGDFCLGVGSYGGCTPVATVPLPPAFWLFGSGLAVVWRRVKPTPFFRANGFLS